MDNRTECPICKKKVLFVGVHDDEGNYHGLVGCEYENDPWSGLSYALHHDGWGDCPMCTDGANGVMGGMLFDAAKDAISALTPPNEPLSCEGCAEIGKWENEYEYGYSSPCTLCKRRAGDNYRRPPEEEEDT